MPYSNFFSPIKNMDGVQRKNVIFIAFTLFAILFSYPIVRSTVDSIFLTSIGAKKSPIVWLYSVLALTFAVSIFNKWQERFQVQRLFLGTSLFSFLFFVVGILSFKLAPFFWGYALFVWKEVYIILLIHIAFGLFNEVLDFQKAKALYGPVGALNGLGGVLGGLATSWLTYHYTTEAILFIGALLLLFCAFLFWQTPHCELKKIEAKKETPLESTKGARNYIFWIVIIVGLSQFCINLVNFKFNILFEAMVPDKTLKTRYLGDINTAMNALSLGVQLIIVPLALRFFSNRSLQFCIPLIYGATALWGFGFSAALLFPVAATFVIFKGMDYSIFSVLKELLYFPLKTSQKYGAKYIVDMIVYRLAKGIISVVLIFWQSASFINTALILSLVFWGVALIPLFHEQKKILGGSR